MTGLFILRHPYILKAISIWSFGFSNLLFNFIRVFYFFKLNISKSDINITRAMGGIGDMVMLRVAIKLHLKLFKNNIYLYIPEKYFPVFHDIPQIRLLNINNKSKSFFSTNYNFTDCPAGHIEGAQYPNIKINRIEAFIYAMNLFLPSSKDQYHLLSFNPSFYPVSNINCINHEGDIFNLQKLKIESNKKVLFYQPYSADSYKNYYNDDLLYKLNLRYIVILIGIDNEIFSNSQLKNTFLLNENLQGFISAVQLSDICLGVDSSLIHIARGFGKPIVTLFGPTDGNLLMKNYPNFKLVQKYSIYFCSPCWRNESIKCRWNNTFVSDCMIVDSEHVLDAVLNLTN